MAFPAVRRGRRQPVEPVVLVTVLLVAGALWLFIVNPLFQVMKQSVMTPEGISFQAYWDVVASERILRIFGNTLVLCTTVSLIATAIGFLFAYTVAYVQVPLKGLFRALAILPVVSPPFLVSLSAILLFGRTGLITRGLLGMENANIYGFGGLVLVMVLTEFPVTFLMLIGLLQNIDVSLEEAARNSGATRWQVFRTVTLPLLLPGLANAFLLVFIQALADFSNPMVIGGNYMVLAVQIYQQAIGGYDLQGGAAVAVLLLLITVAVFTLQRYWLAGRSYVTVTGKPARERTQVRDPWVVWPLFAVVSLLTLVVIAMYALIPINAFIKLWGINWSFTLDNFKYVLGLGMKPIYDTTRLALISMPISGLLGMVIAYLVTKKRFFGRGVMEFVAMLSLAVPGTVIGIGYILAFNKPPLVLTATGTILVLAFVFRNMPVGIRSGIAALQQIDPSMEEASINLGATTQQTFVKVMLPLMGSAFFSGLLYSFVRAMTAVSQVIFLVSAKYNLLTVAILNQVDVGRWGYASAYSTVLILIVLVVTVLLALILRLFGIRTSISDL
ncbi:iron(III) transport system permease protein [Symbiobacterium terraclitae]|uniref:Iron(III) transport system permease protein n=1 Tax=Symbiobacterium terraclitae TaxID=557451 RepID=A0ABS4JTQ4_9FIRM|nr:iron ABC transporter permease [Symbiobacterium terraclitae]MBP2018910.1 iron(III) transport system permease protein [Symbiobacterium terraclitae]